MTLRFSNDGPEFPSEFVDSLLAGEMVFLCGTGISAPQMPDFRCLVERTCKALGVERTASEQSAFRNERFEEVLGSLSRRLAKPEAVTRTVSELLAVPEHPCLDQHHTILRLSRDLENRICVVTTNFDTLLERAANEVFRDETPGDISFAGQALPAPGSLSFSGIVHIHGRLADGELGLENSQLILTSADYGDAYMRSGWAARFLFDLARCKAIALVGYSANDAPVRYFLNVLEADRERFRDLKPVYAFDAYEREPEEATLSWGTLAVKPLPYCKVNPDTGEHDHAPIWRDLSELAEVVERPKLSRRERARSILERPVADASAESRRELGWLFGGRRDLWSVALDAIVDPEWFRFFQNEGLWPGEDSVWVIAAWVAKDFKSVDRFECAREWQERLGQPFTDKIRERLLQEKSLNEIWAKVWRLFCLAEPVRPNDPAYYEVRKRLASGVVLDSDLQDAVGLLAPKLALNRGHRKLHGEGALEPVRRIGDLVWARMVISDRHSTGELVSALQKLPGRSGRILELATSELRSVLALEGELELIGEEHDTNDSTVPSIESHPQNQYRGGVNFLIRAIAECLPQAATLDRVHTRALAIDWKRLPGRIGLRLCLHAMRDTDLFDGDEVMETLLSVTDVDFWSMRRELALLLKERAGNASPDRLTSVEERIRESGKVYYNRFPIERGEADWREHACDAAVWLRLKMLQGAAALSDAGAVELSGITERRKYLDREVEERDYFESYSSGVRQIIGDPTPIVEAPADDRLRVAHNLAESHNLDKQQGWSSFCRSDPQGALDSLSKGDLTPENGRLWDQFLSGLAVGDEESKEIRESVSVQAMDHLAEVEADFLLPMVSGLCDLIYSAPRERIRGVDGWLVKLWEVLVKVPQEPVDFAADWYEIAINSAAGKLSLTLLLEIDARKKEGGDFTDVQLQLVGRISDHASAVGQLGRAVLAHDVAFLLTIDEQRVVKNLGPCIAADNDEGAALRAVLVTHGSITPEVTSMFGQAILKGAAESKTIDYQAATIASNILRPCLADLRGDYTVQWGVTADEVARALRNAQPAIRAGALEVLAAWLQNAGTDVEETWRFMVIPFFERVWPKEREFRDVLFTPHLIELVVRAGNEMATALEFLGPYICPYNREHGSVHTIVESELPESFPRETLDLVWLVCGPESRGRFYEVSEIIDRLIKADPEIEIDRRLQWLEQRAERFD